MVFIGGVPSCGGGFLGMGESYDNNKDKSNYKDKDRGQWAPLGGITLAIN
jgi:hypothetical protein